MVSFEQRMNLLEPSLQLLFSIGFILLLLFLILNLHLILLYIFCPCTHSLFPICFKTIHNCLLEYLKSMSDNSNICAISVWASVDCIFLCELRFSWLFIPWMLELCLGNFQYSLMRLEVDIQSLWRMLMLLYLSDI